MHGGYPGCMVYLVLEANCLRQPVSSCFPRCGTRKRGGNNKETTSPRCKVSHATRVTTLWLKQPIHFYCAGMWLVANSWSVIWYMIVCLTHTKGFDEVGSYKSQRQNFVCTCSVLFITESWLEYNWNYDRSPLTLATSKICSYTT